MHIERNEIVRRFNIIDHEESFNFSDFSLCYGGYDKLNLVASKLPIEIAQEILSPFDTLLAFTGCFICFYFHSSQEILKFFDAKNWLY